MIKYCFHRTNLHYNTYTPIQETHPYNCDHYRAAVTIYNFFFINSIINKYSQPRFLNLLQYIKELYFKKNDVLNVYVFNVFLG